MDNWKEQNKTRVTYAKIRDTGQWGVRGPIAKIKEGAVVDVSRKDGSTMTVQVDKLVWFDNEVALATIKPVEAETNTEEEV